ncbi:hypothetical protein UIB01_15835 [Stutzerimonas decontaminans]|uniref:Uncharacterized protein n=1 Tax=Stutzerimonas stutzeri TaxID=316 RepID=A0A023WZE7_STUST|nr:hypothetical protein UIB01_15835 [Stutzerimonas decontaminans]
MIRRAGSAALDLFGCALSLITLSDIATQLDEGPVFRWLAAIQWNEQRNVAAIGNVPVQLSANGQLPPDLMPIRRRDTNLHPLTPYPTSSNGSWIGTKGVGLPVSSTTLHHFAGRSGGVCFSQIKAGSTVQSESRGCQVPPTQPICSVRIGRA